MHIRPGNTQHDACRSEEEGNGVNSAVGDAGAVGVGHTPRHNQTFILATTSIHRGLVGYINMHAFSRTHFYRGAQRLKHRCLCTRALRRNVRHTSARTTPCTLVLTIGCTC